MKIKVPMLTNAALLTVLLSIIGTIQLFNEPTVMRAGQSWMGNSYTPIDDGLLHHDDLTR